MVQDYHIITLLGQGGFGNVHKALHIATGRLVAIKMVWKALR
jgi:serine/threonine protein kinase